MTHEKSGLHIFNEAHNLDLYRTNGHKAICKVSKKSETGVSTVIELTWNDPKLFQGFKFNKHENLSLWLKMETLLNHVIICLGVGFEVGMHDF